MDRGAEFRAGGHRPHLDVRPRLRPQLHGLLRHDHGQDEEGIFQPGMMINISATLITLQPLLNRIYIQPADLGWPTRNGKKLSSSQAQLDQATCLAVA